MTCCLITVIITPVSCYTNIDRKFADFNTMFSLHCSDTGKKYLFIFLFA